ncbi:hypothetical protein [Nocardioides daeguensis]|uniref:Heavy-metal-associated domain-containing protein n=1 Tax=Nocardioides daeguensis TaxID=908359 RepID=A0ABP6WFA0_9ACTN|nr:hypothetical protein [Nocardioides daeguensis]MBV6728044.1 hypothetical protein [Nocardioides daeguensis]MCR1774118.1 hypothetical protein [Nocardioides daeguensis]
MNNPTRLAGFGAVAAVVFGVALLAGRAIGPVGAEPATHDTHAERTHLTPAPPGRTEIPGGLMTSQDGYTLTLDRPQAAAGSAVPVSFTITGPDGAPVTSYDVQHEKQLHLIAVRRDFSGFQHVHPTLTDGTWSTDLALTPGTWRLFADFKATGGAALTLGTDLAVDGAFEAAAPTEESRTATVDGYQVTLAGDLAAGADARLTLSISKDGKPVTDLQPYLGACGHLVALRSGDLAYLHVHPDGEPGDGTTQPGPDVVFHAAVPSAGTYHLYLDFQHDGVVRTAAFTVTAEGVAQSTDQEHGDTSGHAH